MSPPRVRSGAFLTALVFGLAGCGGGNVFSLGVGACFDDVEAFFAEDAEEIGDVPVVDCEDAHDNEVYALFDLAADDFPGVEDLEEDAAEGCLDRFEPYVGSDYEASRFEIAWLTPTSQSWDAGDREVVCFLYGMDLQELEGSAAGSAR